MDINFEVSRYTQDKHPDSHMHEQYEIFISLSDEGTFFVREEGYPLRFGMVFILAPFLLMIARITNASTFINSPAIKMESRAGEILRYIHANYNQDISLEQLSKEFFISKSRLSEVFKQSTGFSVGNYVIAYRIKIACTLLQSGMNVQDVGYMVGFHTNTHFIRTFKNKTGYSPSNFVKRRSNAVSGTFSMK